MPGATTSRPGRRLHITHRTGYRYADVVDASFNEVRMTPLTGDGQFLLSHTLEVHPSASIQTYGDYWGAQVESFNVHVPHRVLEIIAISTVDTPPLSAPVPGASWADVLGPAVQDRHSELLVDTEYVDSATADPDRAAIVEDMLRQSTPGAAARVAIAAVRDRLAYTPGATDVSTTASEAWQTRHGVCQDFTHTTLSLLRATRIPSYYVSGYLHTEEPAHGQTVTGESHAWVEYWDGHWQALDPTNDRAVGAAHVVVARGRDYADVPPLKGIYAGGHSEALGVSVDITQL
ncbi:MAG: transglutaminase family protein [Actinomycetota bacterium]|nr:transglutaminase family protein [Actinomycetota bacterium]